LIEHTGIIATGCGIDKAKLKPTDRATPLKIIKPEKQAISGVAEERKTSPFNMQCIENLHVNLQRDTCELARR